MNKVNDYQALKDIYYSDTSGKNETYEKEYINRLYSTFSIVYDLSINSYPVFLCITPEIFNILNSLLTKKEQLNNIIRDTKEEIITNYSYITLFNEIENTNKIEGVTSTKKALENNLELKLLICFCTSHTDNHLSTQFLSTLITLYLVV